MLKSLPFKSHLAPLTIFPYLPDGVVDTDSTHLGSIQAR